ncbi:MAG: hypothetical protein ABSG43_01025 [Solirubrobacteraceae bacterium]|jgi:transposase-like protein
MQPFRTVSPRRLTGREEAELEALDQRYQASTLLTAALHRERDQLILRTAQAGARITDIANVLGIDRQSVYNAIDRASRDAEPNDH